MKFLKLYEDFETKKIKKILVGGVPIIATVADTEESQKKGYMFSDGPKDGEGMLFIYPNEQILNFWMKNVSVPLDIIFFDKDKMMVDSDTMLPYNKDDKETYYTTKVPSQFALEVPHGWVGKYISQNNVKLEF